MHKKLREELDEELGNNEPDDSEIKDKKRGPWKYFLALFLIMLLVLMIFPYYSVTLDPSPKNIPTLEEVSEILPKVQFEHKVVEREEFPTLAIPDSNTKLVADWIASQSCRQGKVCHAKALFYFVRDEFDYVSDPVRFEYVKSPAESLVSQGGDCDDASVLLASMLQAIGIKTRFVFIPGHVYIQAYIPDSLKRYRDKDGWVNLDATCRNCEFGELPYTSADKHKTIIA